MRYTLTLATLLFALLAPRVGAVAVPITPATQPGGAIHIHHDHVLGTSMDLTIVGLPRDADAADAAALAEIDRQSRILNTWDPASEVSKLTVAGGATKVSPELIEVLDLYDQWNAKTGGAFNGHLGAEIALWKSAQQSGKPPTDAQIANAVKQAATPAWRIDRTLGTVERLTDAPLTLDAVGKSYIVDHALAAIRAKLPGLRGAMVAIGGDIACFGSPGNGSSWRLGVMDPAHPEDNAPPLTQILIAPGGVTTSGSYARGFDIAGRHYSHILDPRTGRPADAIASATVVAKDAATANALSTSLCVLAPDEGLKLVRSTPGTQCLIVTADGKRYSSDGWKYLVAPTTTVATADKPAAAATDAASNWPKDFQLSFGVTIKGPAMQQRGYRRPFVAIWIEDAKGNPVRTLQVWGNERKYLRDLSTWYGIASGNAQLVGSVTRATRPPGAYKLAWDGTDDAGKPVAPGTYTVRVESVREHGAHVNMSGAIDCTVKPATAKIAGNGEVDDILLTFGPTTPAAGSR